MIYCELDNELEIVIMEKKKVMTLHAMATRLCEGGIVDYNDYALKAKDVGYEENPCYLCSMDCICDISMSDLCAECDRITHTKHILMFAN